MEREREQEIQRQTEKEEMARKRQEEEMEGQTEMEQREEEGRLTETDDDGSEDHQTQDGTMAQDKSKRRRFLGWVNQKVKERNETKIEKTVKREEEEGDVLIFHSKYPINLYIFLSFLKSTSKYCAFMFLCDLVLILPVTLMSYQIFSLSSFWGFRKTVRARTGEAQEPTERRVNQTKTTGILA